MKALRAILTVIGLITVVYVTRMGFLLGKFHRRHAGGLADQRRERSLYPERAAADQLVYVEHDDDRLAELVDSDRAPLSEYRILDHRVRHVFAGGADPRAPAFLELSMTPASNVRFALYHTVAVAQWSSAITDVVIRPWNRADRKSAANPIGDSAFDAAYVVKSGEPERVGALLGRELVERMAALPEPERPTIRLKGEWVVCEVDGPLLFERGKRLFDLATALRDRAAALHG